MEEGATPFPVLPQPDLDRVAETILHLFSPSVSSNPEDAGRLQGELQRIQATPEAWGLISGLAGHEDPNVRFFSAHTAQVKISRDWDTLPTDWQTALLRLLLQTLSASLSPSNSRTHQAGNGIVVRKLFGSLASLLLRIPPHQFPNPLITVINSIQSSTAASAPLPESAPGSGYNTPLDGQGQGFWSTQEGRGLSHKVRLWSLEWLSICVQELGRAAIGEQKALALRKHIEQDMPVVMTTLTQCMMPPTNPDMEKEAEAACQCAESWVTYGIGADELSELLPHLYGLLPLPAASSALVEVLSESIFKFGKGAKILTEPLLSWFTGPSFQNVLAQEDGEPSDEMMGLAKLLAALVEHSADWFIARLAQNEVQALLGVVLRLTGWQGTGNVDEQISELTLPIYPLIQEAIMDSELFSAPYDTDPNWTIAKSFFRELVTTTRQKVRWPGDVGGGLGLGKEEREGFDSWRRDAGEVIVGAYYILRDEMLGDLTRLAGEQVQGNAPWQDIEATLHCIRYSSEAVPLGEEANLPILFGNDILGTLATRPISGKGEERLRLTVVCLIQAYEEWFKFHPTHLPPVLSYLVPSLSSSHAISRSAADALKALCDMCRKNLVEHIGAFGELHGKIGDLGPDEQVKVIQAITSVIQALAPNDAIDPVYGILNPIIYRLTQSISAARTDPNSQPILVQSLNCLTACFKGLSPSDDEMWDLTEDEESVENRKRATELVRSDGRIVELRSGIENALGGLVSVWNGDSEVADSISSLVKYSTLSSDTLISLSPLPLLKLVTDACTNAPSALWVSLASTLTLRINSPPSALTQKRDKTPQEVTQHESEERERWEVVGDASSRLLGAVGGLISQGGVGEHPDVVEAWFKFSSAVATRFPGVLLRLSDEVVQGYMSLGIIGLSAQERFSLKTATEFFVALLSNTRYPSPLEPAVETLLSHFGYQILRAILLSAGSEGPRSVIPNLAELLAVFTTRVNGIQMGEWLTAILGEEGFPSPKATVESKTKLKGAVLRSRTTRKMREALHEFSLVARGLDGTVYGSATS